MRIAYVCMDAGIPVLGCKGASVHVQGVVNAMRRAGHDVIVLGARRGQDLPAWHDIPLHIIPDLSTSGGGPAVSWVRERNAGILATLDAIGSVDLVYERYSLWSFAAMEFARQRGIPGVLEVNAPLIEEEARHRGLGSRAVAERVAARVLHAASHIVAVSEEVADWVNRHPCSSVRADVEPNGIDPMRFQEPAPLRAAPFTIGFLGTLKPWHGVQILPEVLAAARQHVPEARLLIVGDGPERANLLARAASIGVSDGMVCTGAVSPASVGTHLREMDVALAPYPADAPFYFSPLKVVEYMAAGIPTIASAIGQIPDLVQHGVTGLLVPPGDIAALADACVRLHAEETTRHRMGALARHRALARHTWDALVERVLGRALPSTRQVVA